MIQLLRACNASVGFCLGCCLVIGCEQQSGEKKQARVHVNQPIDHKLMQAIRKADAGEVRRLLDKGASPHATEANDWPAVVIAAGESLEVVKLLLAKGADIDAQQPDQGWTPLTQAIINRRNAVALYVLSKGADPELPMADGATPLHMAVRFGNKEIASALLKHKVNVNARTREHPRAVTTQAMDDRTGNYFEPGFKHSGQTPLFEVVQKSAEADGMLKLLLDSGADPRATDDNGWTLLHYAAKVGMPSAVDELLRLGLDPNARSNQDFTPLHVSVRGGYGFPVVSVMKKLLAAGADPTAMNKQGLTPEALLRQDAARLLGSTNLSPTASRDSAQMRRALKVQNEGLQVLSPGAAPIGFPEAPVEDGWSIYPPLELGFFEEGAGKIERKVRSEPNRTLLSLTYKPGKDSPLSLNLEGLELNTYEPLQEVRQPLRANQELIVPFPAAAASEGGAVALKYSYEFANGSGSGGLGDRTSPNPTFMQIPTATTAGFCVHCSELRRPLQFRIDKLTADGKELKQFRGKVFKILPTAGGMLDRHKEHTDGAVVTIPKRGRADPKLVIKYSYRLLGNKKWRSQEMAL